MKENYNPSEISPPQFESWGPVIVPHTAETIDQPKFDPSTLEKNNQRRTEVYVIQQSANVLQTHKQLQAKINYLQK